MALGTQAKLVGLLLRFLKARELARPVDDAVLRRGCAYLSGGPGLDYNRNRYGFCLSLHREYLVRVAVPSKGKAAQKNG